MKNCGHQYPHCVLFELGLPVRIRPTFAVTSTVEVGIKIKQYVGTERPYWLDVFFSFYGFDP